MNKNNMYNVKNRSASVVVIRIPDLGIRRELMPGETIRLSFEELEKLSYQIGGKELMTNFLQIMEDAVTDKLGIPKEAEYYMNEQQIVDLLKSGSIEQFEDCLDFAPIGVIDLVKQFAIKLPLTDTVKIKALKDKTGFDVEKAITNEQADKAPEQVETSKKETTPVTTTNPGRRTNTTYKVVSRD